MTLNVGLAIVMVLVPISIPLLAALFAGVEYLFDCVIYVLDLIFDRRNRQRK